MNRTIKISCILSLLIFVIPFQSCQKVKKVQNDVLEYSLNTLGEKLFSLMGESPEKTNLQEKYNAFVQRAADGDADQDQIEYVAANIMNASNSRESVAPELASSIVDATDPSFEPTKGTKSAVVKKEALTKKESFALGESLSKMIALNDNLKMSYTNQGNHEEFSKKVFYKWDKGIVLNLDEELKSALDEKEYEVIFTELHELEKEHKMEWTKELSKVLKMEHVTFQKEMNKLKEFKMDFEEIPGLKEIEIFTNSDSTFISPYLPDVNIDSILDAVGTSLEEAGISKKVIIKN